MRYEIGSHFEFDHNIRKTKRRNGSWLPSFYDSFYTFSGRSAIELAIKDIRLEREIKSVYMPSYCCKSMVDPFLENDIEVIFYDVYFEEKEGIKYNIDLNTDCDIFFAISYFGIEEFQHDSILKLLKSKGTIIIEDTTHRLLGEESHSSYADYTIASLRKWFPIATGGLISKQKSKLNIIPNKDSDSLIKGKIQAMKQKTDYIDGKDVDKVTFLNNMRKFEKEFRKRDYRYKIDSVSLSILENIDIELVRHKRRNNARTLYDGINELKHIKLLIPNPDFDNISPLFSPIMMERNKRDELRSFLIKHNIYCPVHWPNTEVNSSSISNSELSLICDQRYSFDDMKHIVELITKWYKQNYND